jgi:CRP/FNR family transcriptional regulator, cyclic AMP receptor protein
MTITAPHPRCQVPEISAMAGMGLFGGLPLVCLEFLRGRMRCRPLDAGQFVYRSGESGQELFVVLEGAVEVSGLRESGEAVVFLTARCGDCFGEMSLLDLQPRVCQAQALGTAVVLVITTADLDALYRFDIKAYSLFILNLARELSRRLRRSDLALLRNDNDRTPI